MAKKIRKLRISSNEVTQQMKEIEGHRTKGLSVEEACDKVGIAVPTYYYRLKRGGTAGLRATPVGNGRGRPVTLALGMEKHTLRELKRHFEQIVKRTQRVEAVLKKFI